MRTRCLVRKDFVVNFLLFIMSPKQKANSPDDGIASKKRKAITMEVKLNIIKRFDKGETATKIGWSLGLSRSTVATIIKDKERILEHMKGFAPMKSTVITKQRSGLIIEMERLLVLWLEDQNQRSIPVSLMVIQEKAKRLFEALKKQKGKGCENEVFVASRGWFSRFKNRANFHNIKVQSDEKAEFAKGLAQMINEAEGYCAEHVLKMDKAGFFLNSLTNQRTYIGKEENSPTPASKTLLLGGNTENSRMQLEKNLIDEEAPIREPKRCTRKEPNKQIEDEENTPNQKPKRFTMKKPDKEIIDDGENTPDREPKRFTRKGLAEGFALIEEGLSRFEAEDPSLERYTKAAREVMDALKCYQEILEEKKIKEYYKKIDKNGLAASTSSSELAALNSSSASPPGSASSPAPASPPGSASSPDPASASSSH